MNTGSILIYGGSAKDREKKVDSVISQLDEKLLSTDHPDRVHITLPDKRKSIGINQIRSLLKFMATRPYSSKYKIAVVSPAEKMTTQAQSALLKILEEPPFFTVIILSVKTEESLLPTLVSRCRKMIADSVEEELFEDNEDVVTFRTVLECGVGERLKLAEELAKKEDDFIIDQLEYWVKEERYEMTNHQKFYKHKNIELLLELLQDLEETNVNTRLALENMFFKAHST